jgi:hypothetical protein
MKKTSITQLVLGTKRENAKKSRPRRADGGKGNAVTHGFFTRELAMNDAEKLEFETLRRTLHQQLSPETVLQEVAFAEVLVCIGRTKLALRMEMWRVSRILGDGSVQQAQGDHAEGLGARAEWYLSGRQGLREGIRLLENFKKDFLELGRIDERWNLPLDQAFGPLLREQLTHWMPSDPVAAMAAHQLTLHAKTYNMPLPPSLDPQGRAGVDGENKLQVILDPDQGQQMVIKLLEQQLAMLSDLWKSANERASASEVPNQSIDFAPRYFTTAGRDLHRAVAWYTQLKKEKL